MAELKSGKNGGLYITTPPIFDPVSGKSGNLVDFENMQQDQTNQIDRQNKQTITTANTLYTPEAIENYFNFTRNLPEYKDLENGNKFYENARDALLKVPQRQNNVGWIKPLLALSDSMTGSKLMQGYEEPEQLAPTILAYQKAIQDNKRNQLETLLGSMNRYKSGQQATTIGDLSENRLSSSTKDTDRDPRSFVKPKGGGGKGKLGYTDKKAIDSYASNKTDFQDAIDNADEIDRTVNELESLGKAGYLHSPLKYNRLVEKLRNLSTLAGAAKLRPMSDNDSKILGRDGWSTFANDKDNVELNRQKAKILRRAGKKGLEIQKRIYEGDPQGHGAGKIVSDVLSRKDENDTTTPATQKTAKPTTKGLKTSEIEW